MNQLNQAKHSLKVFKLVAYYISIVLGQQSMAEHTAKLGCSKGFTGLVLLTEYVNVVVVSSGSTSLSTIFQSYHDGVWLR